MALRGRQVGLTLVGASLSLVALRLNETTLRSQGLEVFTGVPGLPPAESVKLLTAGYSQLAADYYWLSAIQYYGTRANEAVDYRDLGRYLDLIFALDPTFCYPYVFAGDAYPRHRPDGLWANTRETIRLLRLGVDACPGEWRIPFLLGYSLFTFTDEYQEAAASIARASRLANAPPYLSSLATRLYGQGGNLETALTFAKARLLEESNRHAKADLQKRIAQIGLEIQLKALRAVAVEFANRTGRKPREIKELLDAGLIDRLPRDPFGDDFFVDSEGEVTSRHEDQLVHMYVRPGGQLQEPVLD